MEHSNFFHSESLTVSVHTQKHGSFDGVVVETLDTAEGLTRVVADFPRAKSPSLPIGDDAALVFSSSSFSAPMQASGRVFMSSEDHFRHRYLFEFKKEQVAPIGQAVNQRRAARVYPDPSEPVTVFLQRLDEENHYSSQLNDISCTGISTVISREDEINLFSQWTLKMHFKLPNYDEKAFEVVGVVRNRKLVDNGIHYGIEFDATETPNYDEFQQRLLMYIMSRQAEGFRRARVLDKAVQEARD